jgi:hypothetical protein
MTIAGSQHALNYFRVIEWYTMAPKFMSCFSKGIKLLGGYQVSVMNQINEKNLKRIFLLIRKIQEAPSLT